MLRSTGLLHVPEEAMLVELLRDLARELDAGGGARSRLAYLSALKDLRRVLNGSGRPRSSAEPKPPAAAKDQPVEPTVDEPSQTNDLADFKTKHGIAS